MMSTFNFNRFLQALKCRILVERKAWIRLFAIYTLVVFMADLFFTRVGAASYSDIADHFSAEELYYTYYNYVESSCVFGIVFFNFAMLFGASSMFSQMKDTRSRSAYLLWPVSNLEKYVVGLLLSIGLMMVLTIGAVVLADALRVLIDWVTGRIVIWGIAIPFAGEKVISNSLFDYWQLLWAVLAWAFYFHSLYIVGGTLFRRHQFLFTSGTIVVAGILLAMLMNQIEGKTDIFDFMSRPWDGAPMVFYPSFYVFYGVLTLLIPFHYWASFKLFCRMQVINNKWLNV